MDDNTPDTRPEATGLPEDYPGQAVPAQPARRPEFPRAEGGQTPRPFYNGITPRSRPIVRPAASPVIAPRPTQQPSDNNSGSPNTAFNIPVSTNPVNPPVPPVPPAPAYPSYQQPAANPVASYQLANQPAPEPPQPAINQVPSQKGVYRKKRLPRPVLAACLLAVALAGTVQVYSWYASRYHSVYNKLVSASYSQNGQDFSFSYPAVMQSEPSLAKQLQSTSVAYTYNVSSQDKALISVSYTPISTTLRNFGISPSELISQIKAKSGNYVDSLTKSDPNLFADTYRNCDSSIATASGSALGCKVTGTTYTVARIIGATANYQYALNLSMPNAVWIAHQNVWQKVEKSFNTQ